jgi:hypothetical protein
MAYGRKEIVADGIGLISIKPYLHVGLELAS